MRVNGRNRLACKLLMQDLGARITVEPMLGFPVIRDLVVDMDPFFAKYEKVKPYLINDEPAPRTERLQSPERIASATTRRRSASSAAPAQAPVHRSGPTRSGLARPPSSTPTASSSIAATGAAPSG